jgi:hypothetical protein
MDESEDLENVIQGITWDRPHYYFKNEIFVPRIYDGIPERNISAEGFNALTIRLDGRLRSDLQWQQARIDAQKYLDLGYALLWEIDLGLFSGLSLPLSNQMQCLSLALSFQHFRDTLWNEFGSNSLGLVVYRGNADFTGTFVLDLLQMGQLREWLREIFSDEKRMERETGIKVSSFEEIDTDLLMEFKTGKVLLSLFCQNIAVEYIGLLTNCLPDNIPRYILLNASSIAEDLLWQMRMLNPEKFDPVTLCIRGAVLPIVSMGWEIGAPHGFIGMHCPSDVRLEKTLIGVCIPSVGLYSPAQYGNLGEALTVLMRKHLSFRLIPESRLMTDWDGLDYILFVPEGLSFLGKRQLQGFCAAGGTAVTVGEKAGLPQEIDFIEFLLSEACHEQNKADEVEERKSAPHLP